MKKDETSENPEFNVSHVCEIGATFIPNAMTKNITF